MTELEKLKKALHEVLDERPHVCFMSKEQQSAALDGVKVIRIIKNIMAYGVAVFIVAGSILALIGIYVVKYM